MEESQIMANKYTAYTKVTETHAQCSDCGEIKPHTEFHKSKEYLHRKGCSYYCKTCACARSRKNHKKRKETDPRYTTAKRSTYFKHKYGLTLEEYTEKLKAQGNVCAICGVELLTSGHLTHLDHCHTTGKLRAFLCTNCNRGLGHFKDSVENLKNAITYLESHTVGDCLLERS